MAKITTFDARAFAALAPFVSREQARYILCGINVEPDGAGGARLTATDGHALGTYLDETAKSNQADFDNLGILATPAKMLTACKVDGRRVVVTEHDNAADSTIEVIDERKGSVFCHKGNPWVEGSYPDWRRVFPDLRAEQVPLPSSFDPMILHKFAAGRKEGGPAVFQAFVEHRAVLVTVPSMPEFTGLIMPIRGDAVGRDGLDAMACALGLPSAATEKQAA